ADEVSRRETACEVDAFTPRAEVAKQGDQDALAECSGFLVVVRVMCAAAQNLITSSRKWSACSRPRRGSRRRSAYSRKRFATQTSFVSSRNASGVSSFAWRKTTLCPSLTGSAAALR